VAAYYVKSIVMYMLFAVQDETHKSHPALHTAYKLPDDGHRPKHVGAL